MRLALTEAVLEALGALFYAAATVAATTAGVLVERASVHTLTVGQTTLGLWEMAMGALALFVGLYLLGYREALPRARSAL